MTRGRRRRREEEEQEEEEEEEDDDKEEDEAEQDLGRTPPTVARPIAPGSIQEWERWANEEDEEVVSSADDESAEDTEKKAADRDNLVVCGGMMREVKKMLYVSASWGATLAGTRYTAALTDDAEKLQVQAWIPLDNINVNKK